MQVQNDFYQGLLIMNGRRNEAVNHFEKALVSSNEYIRQAASAELAKIMYEGAELSAKTVKLLRREAAGAWADVFDAVEPQPVIRKAEGAILDRTVNKEKALAFLLGFERDMPDEARLYILNECKKHGVVFSDHELAAINGHFYSMNSRYNEALVFFSSFMKNESYEWPSRIPELFLQYPGLINDLGRTFQYTASGREGLDLFLQWEMNLADAMTANGGDDPKFREAVQYRLLFFAARIARRMGRHDHGILLFEQALSFAPDAEQSDACIWYILDSSLNGDFDLFYLRLRRLVPMWHEKGYFDDILEKLLQKLTSNSDWEKIIRVFAVIQNSNAAVSIAGYAWVIARVIEEGYLSDREMQLAAGAVNAAKASAEIFMRIVYDTGKMSLYYRLKSANSLGEPFLELTGAHAEAVSSSPALQFLLGFFNNGAANLSLRYITALQNELAPGDLRSVAQALSDNGMHIPSIRLVSAYVNRDGYTRSRQDMELMFPRRYNELVEKYAAQNNFEPSLMYGLIRTESAFQSDIVSHAGAVGLTQLMPDTAADMASRIRRAGGPDFAAGVNGLDLKNPDVNIFIGSFYLNYLTARFEDPLLSLLAYNGGMNRVRRWRSESSLPPDLFLETIPFYETRDYGKRVIAAAMVYEELYYRY